MPPLNQWDRLRKRFSYSPQPLRGIPGQRPHLNFYAGISTALRHSETQSQLQRERAQKSALQTMINDLNTRNPNMRPYTNEFKIKKSYFTGERKNWLGVTGGWIDDRQDQPHVFLNPKAFSDAPLLGMVIGHELGHLIQRHHPDIYRGTGIMEIWPGAWSDTGWRFREFDATLRNIENINRSRALGQSPFNILTRIRAGNRYLDLMQQGDPHWQWLGQSQATRLLPDDRARRWNRARDVAWRNLNWENMPGVLDLPQFRQFTQPSPKPWQYPLMSA